MADIVKAFLLISSRARQGSLRFGWLNDLPKPHEETNVTFMLMTRVPFGTSPSPFLLATTIRHHLKKCQQQHPTVTATLAKCL